MDIRFEWDENKNHSNLRNHHIDFATARHVFDDPLALTEQDRIENGEWRWQTIGMIGGLTIVLVAHTVRHEDDTEIIRIISARKADRKERTRYAERTYQ